MLEMILENCKYDAIPGSENVNLRQVSGLVQVIKSGPQHKQFLKKLNRFTTRVKMTKWGWTGYYGTVGPHGRMESTGINRLNRQDAKEDALRLLADLKAMNGIDPRATHIN